MSTNSRSIRSAADFRGMHWQELSEISASEHGVDEASSISASVSFMRSFGDLIRPDISASGLDGGDDEHSTVSDVCRAVSDRLQGSHNEADMVVECCLFFHSLSPNHPDLLVELVQDDVSPAMMASLRTALINSSACARENPVTSDDPDLHGTAILAVVSTVRLFLRLQPDDMMTRAIGAGEWIDAIHEALKARSNDPQIALICLQVFEELSRNEICLRELSRTSELADTLLSIILIMVQQQKSAIAIAACTILSNTMESVPAFRELAANASGLWTLVEALALHSVQNAACKVLRLTTTASSLTASVEHEREEDRQDLLKRVVSELANVSLSRLHFQPPNDNDDGNGDLQQDIIMTLCHMSAQCPDLNATMRGARAIESTVLAMRKYPQHEEIQESGAKALWLFSSGNRNAGAVGDEGGVNVVLEALEYHQNARLRENCLGALNAMSAYEANQKRIVDAGGVDRIRDASRLGGNDTRPKLCKYGIATLANVAAYYCHHQNTVRRMNPDVLGVISDVALLRPLSSDIMETVGRFLFNYSLHPEHAAHMRRERPTIGPFLSRLKEGSCKCREYESDIRRELK